MNLLSQSPLFASLKTADREAVARHAILRTYRQEELFVQAGDAWPYLMLVKTGTIYALKISSEGRNLIVTGLERGEVFWGVAFFHDNAPMPVTLQSQTDSELYLWDRESLLPILLKNSQALWELARLMANRMAHASGMVEDLAFQPVAGRLARLLLEHFKGSGTAPVARDLTLDEMAAHIGTTREVVCRILYRFSDEQWIHITRTEFALTDETALAQLVGKEVPPSTP